MEKIILYIDCFFDTIDGIIPSTVYIEDCNIFHSDNSYYYVERIDTEIYTMGNLRYHSGKTCEDYYAGYCGFYDHLCMVADKLNRINGLKKDI